MMQWIGAVLTVMAILRSLSCASKFCAWGYSFISSYHRQRFLYRRVDNQINISGVMGWLRIQPSPILTPSFRPNLAQPSKQKNFIPGDDIRNKADTTPLKKLIFPI